MAGAVSDEAHAPMLGVQPIDEVTAGHPVLAHAIAEVTRQFPSLERHIGISFRAFGREFLDDGERVVGMVQALTGEGDGFAAALTAYVRLSVEYLKLQRKLEQSGRYPFSRFADARRAVYDNPEVMDGYYLHGLLLSEIFWQNHYRLLRYFRDRFVADLPAQGRLAEVGIGHGLFGAEMLERRAGWALRGIDISRSSLRFASRVLDHYGIAPDRYDLVEGDAVALDEPDGAFDAVVCGEVLEHLEHPETALAELARVVRPGGRVFITAAIYAANIDHIWLFESVDQLRLLLDRVGFERVSECPIPVSGQEFREGMERVPLSYATVVVRS